MISTVTVSQSREISCLLALVERNETVASFPLPVLPLVGVMWLEAEVPGDDKSKMRYETDRQTDLIGQILYFFFKTSYFDSSVASNNARRDGDFCFSDRSYDGSFLNCHGFWGEE